MLSRKGGGQGQLVPGHPLATTRLLNLEMCVLLFAQQSNSCPTRQGPWAQHGLCVVVTVVVTVEKRRWSSVLPRERQGPNGSD